MKRIIALVVVFVLLVFTSPAWGAMSSTNYYIYADNVSVGGNLSTGGEYSLQDTVGESFNSTVTSSSYEIRGGYQAMEQGEISLDISTASLSLGSLVNYTASNTASTTVSVNSSGSGFSLSISSVTGSILANVSDGVVDGDSDSEEYGISASGTYAAFADDQAVSNGLVLASSTVAADSDTVLTFKAIRNASTTPGVYSQSIVLSASASL